MFYPSHPIICCCENGWYASTPAVRSQTSERQLFALHDGLGRGDSSSAVEG
jgi:hypothetical protein